MVWAPPLLFSDTATGLLAWRNFAAGGTWNTVAEPSAANLAINVEYPVTWWSPGQYAPLGLLTSAGLPLGIAMLTLALASAASLGVGMVRLARALGSPEASLPWLAFAAVGSWHTLYAFGMFIGREVMLIAVWPWIILAAWRLRTRPILQIALLPFLLLLGVWSKHSFMLWALALLAFLWLEEVRAARRVPVGATARLALIFLFVMAGRELDFFGTNGPNPGQPGQMERGLAASLGFSFLGPVLAGTGGGSLAGRLFAWRGVGFEIGWSNLSWLLTLVSPVLLCFYGRLAMRTRPIERLAGIACLVAAFMMTVLMFRGASVSLEDRHFRPAGVLLLAVAAILAVSPKRLVAQTARTLLIGVVAFGFLAALQRAHSLHERTYPAGNHAALSDMPATARIELQRLASEIASVDGVLFISSPETSAVLPPCRLIATDAADRTIAWIGARPRHGLVRLLALALPSRLADDGRAAALRASFVDFPADAWSLHSVSGWDFWTARAGTGVSP